MLKRQQILACERIAGAYDDVRETLLGDPLGILQRATTTGLSGLFGAKLRVSVGPLEVAGEIVADIVAIEQCRMPNDKPATELVIEWGAMRSPNAFPIMHATIALYPVTATETALELRGTYEPPLGIVGAVADAIAMHHIAEESFSHFARDLARLLGRISHVSAGT